MRTRISWGAALIAITSVQLLTAPAEAAEIASPGPLTLVGTTPDLNCYVNHIEDSVPEFYGKTACGTLVAAGGVLYGPQSIPAGSNASPRTPWTRVSESPVTGDGNVISPYAMTTVATGGPLRLSQVDTYVPGLESYRTDSTVTNTSTQSQTITVYRAGDCYLQNSDYGYGRVDSDQPSCLAQSPTGGKGQRIEQFAAITPGSDYYHATYSQVWSWIGSQRPFPNTCRCDDLIDNGAGVSWTRTLAPGASETFSNLITFSPVGNVPISITKMPDRNEVAPGGLTGYTITVTNPNIVAVRMTSLTDDHPEGFSYIRGSTSGMTNDDPVINPGGNRLSWGPFTLPPNGTSTLHFTMRVSDTPGTYVNVAGGTAEGYTVIPQENPPPVDVPVDPDQSLKGDLVVEKSADEEHEFAGLNSGYTITLSNSTTKPIAVERVTETLPDGARYRPGTTSLLTTKDPEIKGQRLTWRVSTSVPPLSAVKLHFGVTLPLTPEAQLRNPTVTASTGAGSVLPAHASAPVTLLEPPILGPMQLEKRPNRRTVHVGDRVRFTLTATDRAPKTRTTAKICDRVPSGLTQVRAPGSTRSGNRLCWTFQMRAGLLRRSVSYTVRAGARARGQRSSVATVTALQRDPARTRGGVRVLPLRAPAVTG